MRKRAGQSLLLSRAAQKTIYADVIRRPQIEACGLFLGRMDTDGNWLAEQAQPLQNTAASPVYFEFDPAELLQMELAYPGQIVGVYHSHPTGFPRASETDCQNMQRVNQEQQIPWVWLIISGPFDAYFVQQAHNTFATIPLIAYHHFATAGLQRVPIALGEG